MTNSVCSEIFSKTSENYKLSGIEPGVKCGVFSSLGVISGLSLFVVACIAASGSLTSAPTIGWVTIGLGGGSYICGLLLGGDLKKRRFGIISTGVRLVTAIVLTALAITGTLSAVQLGWGIIGVSLASIPMGYFRSCDPQEKYLFPKN